MSTVKEDSGVLSFLEISKRYPEHWAAKIEEDLNSLISTGKPVGLYDNPE